MTTVLLLAGCQMGLAPSDVYFQAQKSPEYFKAIAARTPQVVYRIDAQRYVTLERYEDCDAFFAELYYNDTAKGIHTLAGRASGTVYQGRIINADPTGNNLVVPSADLPYSTDAGRNFKHYDYLKLSKFTQVRQESGHYTIAAIKDQIIVEEVDYPRGAPNYGDSPNVGMDRLIAPSEKWVHSSSHTLLDLPLPASGEDQYVCSNAKLPEIPKSIQK